jgi:hypothetical protein
VIGNLLDEGLFDIGEPSPHDGRAPVRHTDAGASRYSELCRRQRRKADPATASRAALGDLTRTRPRHPPRHGRSAIPAKPRLDARQPPQGQ